MKIFSRGNDPAKTQEKPQAASAPAASAAAQAPPPSAPAQAAPAPEIGAIIEANVKEMSEKISKLANTVEGSQSDRSQFEEKLAMMEERMRKLSSLTEMISAQYNPFVGAAPEERDPFPAPEVGLAQPPVSMPAPAPAAYAEPPVAAPPLVLELPPLPAMPAPEPIAAPSPDAAPTFFDAPAPSWAEAEPREEPRHAASTSPAEALQFRLWNVRPSFEASILMLSWADLLLKHSPTRESYSQLLEYYHNIGWIGDPVRDHLLAYAAGIRHAPPAQADEWRPSADVHEKSLLYLEKLRALGDPRRE